MATTIHYISITAPSNTSLQNLSGGSAGISASGTQNINDGTLTSTSPSTDPVGIWWTDTGVLATRTTKKQLLLAMRTILRFIERGGYRTGGGASQDTHIPT